MTISTSRPGSIFVEPTAWSVEKPSTLSAHHPPSPGWRRSSTLLRFPQVASSLPSDRRAAQHLDHPLPARSLLVAILSVAKIDRQPRRRLELRERRSLQTFSLSFRQLRRLRTSSSMSSAASSSSWRRLSPTPVGHVQRRVASVSSFSRSAHQASIAAGPSRPAGPAASPSRRRWPLPRRSGGESAGGGPPGNRVGTTEVRAPGWSRPTATRLSRLSEHRSAGRSGIDGTRPARGTSLTG